MRGNLMCLVFDCNDELETFCHGTCPWQRLISQRGPERAHCCVAMGARKFRFFLTNNLIRKEKKCQIPLVTGGHNGQRTINATDQMNLSLWRQKGDFRVLLRCDRGDRATEKPPKFPSAVNY